jgi:hypothetical protein
MNKTTYLLFYSGIIEKNLAIKRHTYERGDVGINY